MDFVWFVWLQSIIFTSEPSVYTTTRTRQLYFSRPGCVPGLAWIRTTKIGIEYEIHTEACSLIVCVGHSENIVYFSEPSCKLGLLDSLNKVIWQMRQVALETYRCRFEQNDKEKAKNCLKNVFIDIIGGSCLKWKQNNTAERTVTFISRPWGIKP